RWFPMTRGRYFKLSKLLLKKAEQVNPFICPAPLPFPNHADPDFKHPFGIADARNVLFVGSGEQFARWTNAMTDEVFGRILGFGDLEALKWQKPHLQEQVAKFFGDPFYQNRPALLWTGQYTTTYWYGVEKLRGPVEDEVVLTRLYRVGSTARLGD